MTIRKILLAQLFVLSLLLLSCSSSIAPPHEARDIKIIGKESYQDLVSEYERYSYQLDALDQGVPPIILKALPDNLAEINSSREKKAIFFKAMLPMILLANDEIRYERGQLLDISSSLNSAHTLTDAQQHTLEKLAKRYKLAAKPLSTEQIVRKLLLRIDTIPADLVLAQSANESAWGTSRFTRLANNLFGQWTFVRGQGIVPENRPVGETYEVRKFATVYESVRSYLLNLNTHPAYRQLRELRAGKRSTGNNPDGVLLAEGLLRYSTRGEDYVRELQAMIRSNKLGRFTDAKLRVSS
ncbi:MAG: hypothetical protein C0622_01250 [Desulfuromonas sp.]|nr:MAG: hypothetical protein C0622_01250 [Desulfuromonas sp.]